MSIDARLVELKRELARQLSIQTTRRKTGQIEKQVAALSGVLPVQTPQVAIGLDLTQTIGRHGAQLLLNAQVGASLEEEILVRISAHARQTVSKARP